MLQCAVYRIYDEESVRFGLISVKQKHSYCAKRCSQSFEFGLAVGAELYTGVKGGLGELRNIFALARAMENAQ